MNRKLTATAVLVVLGFSAVSAQADFLQGRELQGAKKGKKFYGDKPAVNFKAELGCGACIRGGFTFCMPSVLENPDVSVFKSSKPVCCQDATCVTNTLKNATWSCSNSYADPITAVTTYCPNDKNKCGNNTIEFTDVGQSNSANMTLSPGDSCTYKVHASKGLPKTKLNNDTTGIDCQFLEFDDDDLEDARLLQAVTTTSAPMPKMKKPLDTKKAKPTKDDKNMKNKTGPIAKTFDPSEGDSRPFKDGAKKNANDTITKNRYQYSTCTNMMDVANDTLRMLQSSTTTVSVGFSTTDFLESSSDSSGSGATYIFGALSAVMISAIALLF